MLCAGGRNFWIVECMAMHLFRQIAPAIHALCGMILHTLVSVRQASTAPSLSLPSQMFLAHHIRDCRLGDGRKAAGDAADNPSPCYAFQGRGARYHDVGDDRAQHTADKHRLTSHDVRHVSRYHTACHVNTRNVRNDSQRG